MIRARMAVESTCCGCRSDLCGGRVYGEFSFLGGCCGGVVRFEGERMGWSGRVFH